jgi:hypothetical protein
MQHVPKNSTTAEREFHMRSKLRTIFLDKIYPLVEKDFGWLFDPIKEWLQENKIKLYAHFVTGVTAGKLFWPRSHTDPDVWYTVLVCIDYGRGIISGGDFSFASVGHILECKHGDILIYNPQCYHGTTEFQLHENDEASGRIFFAFFMKKATLHAAFLSKALHKRVGVQPLICCEDDSSN